MPLFSDLSSLSHYYSGGSTSLNYLSGPYAGHSSIVAANYRTPTSTYSKPSSRAFTNRGYKPHLATISENQMTRAGLSRLNSPKMMYHASPKYKIQKPIPINTADIDVSSNRYRRNLERTPLPISKTNQTPLSPERTSPIKENKETSPKRDEDSEGIFMPRIDKNFRSTIKRERTVVRFHTARNLDKLDSESDEPTTKTDESSTKTDEPSTKTEEEKRLETVKVFDEEVKLHKQKWRENFDPDELSPTKKRPQQQKPLSERLVEKFIIKEKLDEDVLNFEERRRQREENLLNYDGKCNIQRNSSRRKSVKKVPSFHDICRTISSESINEDLNPGQPVMRRYSRKKSSYDVLKAIRRDSAEINQEEIMLLDALIKEAHLDKEYEIENKEEIKTEEPTDKADENDIKRKKKFTKKKSNEKLVDDLKEDAKCLPQRRKIVKKKTSGSLDMAIEAITPKQIKIDNTVEFEDKALSSPTRKTMPKITGTVEIDAKPNLKLVIDDIQVEETVMTASSSPTSKKFKYNVIIEEIKSPNILENILEIDFLNKNFEPNVENNKIETIQLKDINHNKLDANGKILIKKESKDTNKMISNENLDVKSKESLNKAEIEKQKMLDKLIGKVEEPKLSISDKKAEEEKAKMLDKLLIDSAKKSEEEKAKILDKLSGKKVEPKLSDSAKKAEEEKIKILDKLVGKKDNLKLIDSAKKAEEEKAKMLDKLCDKKVEPILSDSATETKDEKAKMLDKLVEKKDEPKLIDSAKKAEEDKAKMLDKLCGKKEEPKLSDSAKKAEEEKTKMLDKLVGKTKEPKLADSTKKAEEEKVKMPDNLLGKIVEPKLSDSAKKAEEQKAKMLDKLVGKKEEPMLTESAKKAEEEKAKMLNKLIGKPEEPKLSDSAKKAKEEEAKLLDKPLGKKVEPIKIDTAKKAEEEKAKMIAKLLGKDEVPKLSNSLKRAEEEKLKMVDKLIDKTEDDKLTDSVKKAEEEKTKMLDIVLGKKDESKLTDSAKKAEEEKAKMIDKLFGKKDASQDSVIKQNETSDANKKAEEEKAKMVDKLLGKNKSIEKDVAKKAEDEKNKMLDIILGKKPLDLSKDLNKTLQKDQPKLIDKKLDITSKLVDSAKLLNESDTKIDILLNKQKSVEDKSKPTPTKPNLSSKVTPKNNKVELGNSNRRKIVQKQEHLDELDIDNFWDKMGKRETIYYKDRRKYLNDRREQELKDICWNPDWVEEEAEEESESPKKSIGDNKQKPKDIQTPANIPKEPIQELPKPKYAQTKLNIIKQNALKQGNLKLEEPQTPKLSAEPKPEEKIAPKEVSKKLENKQKSIESPTVSVKDKPKVDLKPKIVSKKEDTSKAVVLEARTEVLTPKLELKVKSVEKVKLETETSKPLIQELPKQLDTKVKIGGKDQVVSKNVNKEPLKTKLGTKSIENSLDVKEELSNTFKDIQKPKLGVKPKEEILDTKEPSKDIQKLKLGVKSKEETSKDSQIQKLGVKSKEETSKGVQKPILKALSKDETTDTEAQRPNVSNKQKSEECNKNIQPKGKRKSKELKKHHVNFTELQEMKVEIIEVKHEPIKPQLSFIIKDKFDPILKPNKDIIIPTAEEFARQQEENKDGENRLGDKKTIAPMQSNYLAPEPKPKPKPKWFDTCPVVIMATPRDLRGRGHRMQKAAPKVTYVSDSSSSAESDSSDEETSSSDTSGGSDVFETNVVFENNKNAGNKWKSTSSNDSGFDSSAPGSPANNRNRIDGSSNASTSSNSDSPAVLTPANNPAFILEPMEASTAYTAFQRSGRVTPPATSIPRFRKYAVEDFCFLKVLGKGSFGKVMLAELRNTEYYYAVKCLKKDIVLEDDDVECTLIERKVLALGTKHPYLCHLFCTFQTESHLFFVMEYLNGGDLMFHIQMSGRFPEPRARFYGAEIVSGLKFLHSKGIVYRDLKLDNILLDFDGHVRIADFGMCKLQIFLDRTADTFCGTPDYMAPEIIKGQHYNQGVDWWSFGVLLYEMLIGQSPFSGCDEDELFWSICNERPVIPAFLSREASQILTLLLEKDSAKRLGNKYCPAGDISDQSFFSHIDWGSLERRQLEAPFKPKVQHPLDTQYFDKAFTAEKAKLTPIEKDILHSMDQTQFHGFSYTNPNATDK